MKPSDCDFQHECPDTFAEPGEDYPDDFFYYSRFGHVMYGYRS